MLKRVTWFVSGAIAGIAGAGIAKRKVKHAAAQLAPANLAKSAVGKVKEKAHDVADAVRDGRDAMHDREAELRAQLEGGSNTDPLDVHEVIVIDQPGDARRMIVVDDARDVRDDHVGPRRTSRRGRRGA